MVTNSGDSRREFIKKAAYVVPAVLTLNLALAKASSASTAATPIFPKTRDTGRATDIRYQRDVTR